MNKSHPFTLWGGMMSQTQFTRTFPNDAVILVATIEILTLSATLKIEPKLAKNPFVFKQS